MSDGGSDEQVTGGAFFSPADGAEEPGPAALDQRLREHLTEQVVLVRPGGHIVAAFGPPGGLLGNATQVARRALDFAHPDDVVRTVELSETVFDTEPGWEGRWTARL